MLSLSCIRLSLFVSLFVLCVATLSSINSHCLTHFNRDGAVTLERKQKIETCMSLIEPLQRKRFSASSLEWIVFVSCVFYLSNKSAIICVNLWFVSTNYELLHSLLLKRTSLLGFLGKFLFLFRCSIWPFFFNICSYLKTWWVLFLITYIYSWVRDE